MSAQFSDTSGKSGIIQMIERNVFGEQGYGQVSGNTMRMATFTSEVNLALSRALAIIFKADGRWQYDDNNHTDYPIITTNLVDGQRDYAFTVDEQGNLILDIYDVAILPSATATLFTKLNPVDAQTQEEGNNFIANVTSGGTPTKYDKTANGIFLDPIPNYNATNGLKIYINRESSFFSVGDTTKKPGIAGLFHEYLALRPSFMYAMRHGLKNKSGLEAETLRMEGEIGDYYTRREKDVRHGMRARATNDH